MTESEGLSQRLIAVRSVKGLSQQALADASGVAAAQVSRYESGRSSPRPEVVAKLSAALAVDFDWLLTGNGPAPFGVGGFPPRLVVHGDPNSVVVSLSADLRQKLLKAAEREGRDLAGEVLRRLAASFDGGNSAEQGTDSSDDWSRMRALRQRSSALTAEQTELKRAKREMIEAAPRDEKGAISDEHARMQIWKLTSRLYDLQTEILDVDREMDRLYELFAGSAPGAGRSGVGGKPKL